MSADLCRPTPAPDSRSHASPVADGRTQAATDQTPSAESEGALSHPEAEAEAADAERQDFDATSGLAFFQRAHRRLVVQQSRSVKPAPGHGGEPGQLLTYAGDQPLPTTVGDVGCVPLPPDMLDLVDFYFDTCVVTYRMFAQRTAVRAWAAAAQRNTRQGLALSSNIGPARAAISLAILAVALLKRDRVQSRTTGSWDERPSLQKADQYCAMAASLVEADVGPPCLESAQARLLQVLYLLQTARMNKAWCSLGSAWHIMAAMELHRRQGRKHCSSAASSIDYIALQGQRRTFWVAYTIDVYLSVVLGRPRHIHDDDVDQSLPDAVRDENMAPAGPLPVEPGDEGDSDMDSVRAHVELTRIIGAISREVYSIKAVPREERLAAASRLGREVRAWQDRLPPHLSSVNPRSLIAPLRRQAMAMRLARCHAVMHANRPFLLVGHEQRRGVASVSSVSSPPSLLPLSNTADSAAECVAAAQTALRTVEAMAVDDGGALLHAFWWTPYVTFCALAVVYIWEIQQSSMGTDRDPAAASLDSAVSHLAEKCHARLAASASADSPSWRYTVILEELRQSARVHQHADMTSRAPSTAQALAAHPLPAAHERQGVQTEYTYGIQGEPGTTTLSAMPMPFQEWQTTDWRDLDASVSLARASRFRSSCANDAIQAFGLFEDLSSLDLFIPDSVM